MRRIRRLLTIFCKLWAILCQSSCLLCCSSERFEHTIRHAFYSKKNLGECIYSRSEGHWRRAADCGVDGWNYKEVTWLWAKRQLTQIKPYIAAILIAHEGHPLRNMQFAHANRVFGEQNIINLPDESLYRLPAVSHGSGLSRNRILKNRNWKKLQVTELEPKLPQQS